MDDDDHSSSWREQALSWSGNIAEFEDLVSGIRDLINIDEHDQAFEIAEILGVELPKTSIA